MAAKKKREKRTALFSERYGYTKPRDVMQVDSMDERLTNRLWSAYTTCLFPREESYTYRWEVEDPRGILAIQIWRDFLALPADGIPTLAPDLRSNLSTWFVAANWAGRYDFIEFCALKAQDARYGGGFVRECNRVLEEECSGWRFIDGQLAPISSKEEIAEIETAAKSPVDTAGEHIRKALQKFGNRTDPDYRGAAKDAIDAVEAVGRDIIGEPKATLGDAAKKLRDPGIDIHPALVKTLSTFYGYTSDAIRHAMEPGGPPITQDDARFMLVTCSAWVNLLVAKKGKTGGKT